MTNSSWTQAHLTSLITSSRSSFLASLFLLDDKSVEKHAKSENLGKARKSRCEVVFPPCDTKALEGLGKLDKRKREIVSLAQFR
jgi:alpha-1,2-mannosyltransferase